MNLKTKLISLGSILALAVSLSALSVQAASLPALILSTNGSGVQAIVSNADVNAQVTFYYPGGSVVIGTTDNFGNLTATINPSSYHLSLGNPVYVVVDGEHSFTATWPSVSSGSSSGTTIYISQPAVTLAIGQNTSIPVSNASNDLSIPGNTNPSAVTASVSGSNVNLNGLSAGTAVVTVCSASAGCGNINVTVQPAGMMSSPVYLSPSSATISVNQAQTVAITGYVSGPYYVSNNSSTAVVSAAISGSNLMLTGLSDGGSNITVCATGGQCASMYVTVSGTSNGTSSNLPLALQSMTISSNNTNGTFASAGNVITISFTADQQIANPQLSVNGQNILVSGSGNGPYTASYTVSSSQSSIPLIISMANSSGATASASFAIGNGAAPVVTTTTSTPVPAPTPANTTTVTCPAGYTCTQSSSSAATTPAPTAVSTPAASSSSYAFNTYLYMGINNIGDSDPDVVALQERLKKDGFFAGANTGYFGPQTKAAVVAFQKAHDLNPLGVVGPSTRALLNQGM